MIIGQINELMILPKKNWVVLGKIIFSKNGPILEIMNSLMSQKLYSISWNVINKKARDRIPPSETRVYFLQTGILLRRCPLYLCYISMQKICKSDNYAFFGWEKKTAGLYEMVINRLKDILYGSHYIKLLGL